jgi:cytochrome c553
MRTVVVIAALLWACPQAFAASINEARAHTNYMLYCQGCHTPDGTGYKSIPRLKGEVGRFLTLPEGRDFLVRVPGAATSILSDSDLAEVLNWIILTFGENSTPANFRHYTAEEVAKLRSKPLVEIVQYRKQLIRQLGGIKY